LAPTTVWNSAGALCNIVVPAGAALDRRYLVAYLNHQKPSLQYRCSRRIYLYDPRVRARIYCSTIHEQFIIIHNKLGGAKHFIVKPHDLYGGFISIDGIFGHIIITVDTIITATIKGKRNLTAERNIDKAFYGAAAVLQNRDDYQRIAFLRSGGRVCLRSDACAGYYSGFIPKRIAILFYKCGYKF
jgi:hypothetical protein